eukprot:419639-Pleurochrysis_carterae.AAC.4
MSLFRPSSVFPSQPTANFNIEGASSLPLTNVMFSRHRFVRAPEQQFRQTLLGSSKGTGYARVLIVWPVRYYGLIRALTVHTLCVRFLQTHHLGKGEQIVEAAGTAAGCS